MMFLQMHMYSLPAYSVYLHSYCFLQENALQSCDPEALNIFVSRALHGQLEGHWSDIGDLLAVFLSSERCTHASTALASSGTPTYIDEARQVILGAQLACYIWSNPAGFELGLQHSNKPSPEVRHHFRCVLSWISLFFAHPTSTLLNEVTLEYASHVLGKAVSTLR